MAAVQLLPHTQLAERVPAAQLHQQARHRAQLLQADRTLVTAQVAATQLRPRPRHQAGGQRGQALTLVMEGPRACHSSVGVRPLRLLVTSRPFDFAIYLIITANGLLLGKEDKFGYGCLRFVVGYKCFVCLCCVPPGSVLRRRSHWCHHFCKAQP